MDMIIPKLRTVKLEDLTDNLLEKLKIFYTMAQEKGIPIIVTCTSRTRAMQTALYAQGRKILSEVNALRVAAGMYKIGPSDNKYKVTWTMNSKHIQTIEGEKVHAFDIAVISEGKMLWTKVNVNKNDIDDYIELADIGRGLGLRCGADFKNSKGKSSPDYPHYEELV